MQGGFNGRTGGLLTRGTLELLVYKVNREKDIIKRAAFILHTIATYEKNSRIQTHS